MSAQHQETSLQETLQAVRARRKKRQSIRAGVVLLILIGGGVFWGIQSIPESPQAPLAKAPKKKAIIKIISDEELPDILDRASCAFVTYPDGTSEIIHLASMVGENETQH